MRLSQIARKLNIRTERIVSFLKKKNIIINNKPNTKLTSEYLKLLEKEFSGSLSEKKKAEKIVITTPKKHTHTSKEANLIKTSLTNNPTEEKNNPKEKSYNPLINKQETSTKPNSLKGLTLLGKIKLNQNLIRKKEKHSSSEPRKSEKSPIKNTLKSKPFEPQAIPSFSKKKPKPKSQEFIKRQAPQIRKSKYQKEKKARLIEAQIKEEKKAIKEEKILRITEFITAKELAELMNIPINKLLTTCMDLGIIASINQRLDSETIIVVADELGFKVEFITTEIKIEENIDTPEDLLPRAPIVTVMGHVNHGKTSLLDYIKKTQVVENEAGNITQHIGAYQVQTEDNRSVVFLDTPGHEAFTAMRAHGAKITDIAIIIIAADDGIMPQTKEAINHAQLAGIPIVIAINKIDKPDTNSQKIKEQLAQLNIMVEDWGGKYQCQEISAKKGIGIEKLLEKILLEADMLSLKANPNKKARGVVIEASLDLGRGYLTTLMVQEGTLKKNDIILAGPYFGRVKAMLNPKGIPIHQAPPSTPTQILGLNGAPNAGQKFIVANTKQAARDQAIKNAKILRSQRFKAQYITNLDQARKTFDIGSIPEVNIMIKGDVDGSIEAVADALLKLATDKINVKIIYKAVGHISESDIILANTSNAIIIGFQTKITPKAQVMKMDKKVKIKLYNIIYDAIDYIKKHIEGLSAPKEKKEIILAKAEVKKTFVIPDIGTIAGCQIVQGTIKINHTVCCKRKNKLLYTGPIKQLQRKSKIIKEAKIHSECGISFNNFNNILVGDIIEAIQD